MRQPFPFFLTQLFFSVRFNEATRKYKKTAKNMEKEWKKSKAREALK
jgi:hypothetical protein